MPAIALWYTEGGVYWSLRFSKLKETYCSRRVYRMGQSAYDWVVIIKQFVQSALSGMRLVKTHGSALFTRGETQAIATVLRHKPWCAKMKMAWLAKVKTAHGALQLPPYSCWGSVVRMGGCGRRWDWSRRFSSSWCYKLYCQAEDEFPTQFVIRCLRSLINGSSVYGVVCGRVCWRWWMQGVPLKAPVRWYRNGLIKRRRWFCVYWLDILGDETLGDMRL